MQGISFTKTNFLVRFFYHHHHHKHQGLNPLIRSVSKITTALSIVSSIFQLLSFLEVCSGMISKGFGFVAFFASVKAGVMLCLNTNYLPVKQKKNVIDLCLTELSGVNFNFVFPCIIV